MAKCIDLGEIASVLKVNLSENRTAEANKDNAAKRYKYDTHVITPQLIFDLFTGSRNEEGETAFDRIRDLVDNNNVIKRLFGATRNVDKNNPLFAGLMDAKGDQAQHDAGQRMQIRGLVMKHIIGAIKTENDVENNLHVNEEDKAALFAGGSRKVSTLGMATAIGRDIAYTMGFKISADPGLANRVYNQIGMNAINELSKNTELVIVENDDHILNNKIQKNRFEPLNSGQTVIKGYTTVRLNYDKLLDGKATDEHINHINKSLEDGKSSERQALRYPFMNTIGIIDGSSKYVNRMSVPSNEAVPVYNNPGVTSGNGIKMSPENQELLHDMQKATSNVNPRVGKFFLYLSEEVAKGKALALDNKSETDFESIIKKTVGKDKDLLNFIFGTFDQHASEETKAKAVGQELSKTSSVQVLIEDAEMFFNQDGTPKELYFQHDMYRTGRVGFLQTIMNPQTDKFFSRFVLDGGEYTVRPGTSAYTQLINGIEDDSGISPALIVGTETTPAIEALISEYKKTFMSGLTGKKAFDAEKKFYTNLMNENIMVGGKRTNFPGLKGSLWQQLSSIEAIVNVRDSKGKNIKTRFQTKPDATGSGIVLQLLQMMGLESSSGSIEHLEKLGLFGDTEADPDFDVYSFLRDAITAATEQLHDIKDLKGKEYDDAVIENVSLLDMNKVENGKPYYNDTQKSLIFIQKMLKNGFVSNMRDIAKPTTMITSYLAGKDTVMAETGTAYTDSIYAVLESGHASKAQVDFVKQIVDNYNEKNPDSQIDIKGKNSGIALANTEGLRSALIYEIGSTTGAEMFSLIDQSLTNGAVSSFHEKIKDLYTNMSNLAKEQDRLIDEGLAPDDSQIELKVLPAQIVMDMLDFPNSDSWKNKDGSTMTKIELLDAYGMRITSSSQTLGDVEGKDTLFMTESMNSLTSLVNVIHSSDSAAMFRSHRKTRDKIREIIKSGKEDGKKITAARKKELQLSLKQGTFSIHDANNGNAIYNDIFQKEYRNTLADIVANYDMYKEMVEAYEAISLEAGRVNTEAPLKADGTINANLQKKKTEAEDSLNSKKKIIKDNQLNLDSDRTFGFKDELDLTVAEETQAEPEVTEETQTETETKEKTTEELFEDAVAERAELKKTYGDNIHKNPSAQERLKALDTKIDQLVNILDKKKNTDANEEVPFLTKEKGKTSVATIEEIDGVLEKSTNPAVVLLRKLPMWKKFITKEGISSKFHPKTNRANISQIVPKGFTVQEAVEHEITHFMTHAYLSTKEAAKTAAYRYLKSAIDSLSKDRDAITAELKANGDAQALKRLNYVLDQKSELSQMSELTAILSAENESSQAIYDAVEKVSESKKMNQNLFKRAIDSVVNAAKSLFRKGPHNLRDLTSNVAQIINDGDQFNKVDGGSKAKKARANLKKANLQNTQTPQRKAFMKKINHKPYEPAAPDKFKTPFLDDAVPMLNNWASSAIANMVVDDRDTFRGAKSFHAADKMLADNFPIYANNREVMLNYWGRSPFMQAMKGMLQPERFGDRITMERLISLQNKAAQDRGTMDNNLIANMNAYMKDMTEEEIADIYDVTAQAPIFNLIKNGFILRELVEGKTTADLEIAKLLLKLKTKAERAQIDKKAESMADMLVGSDKRLSLYDSYNSDTSKLGKETQEIFEQIVALKAIQKAKNSENGLRLLRENTELYNLIVDASAGMKNQLDLIYGNNEDGKRYRENLVVDQFENEWDLEAVTQEELSAGLYAGEDGWVILRRPDKRNYGIAYRQSNDETYQEGAGTTVSYKHTDVVVPKNKQMVNPQNVLSTDLGRTDKRHKMVLTRKEKDTLGLVRNPADAIYRAYSRLMEISETQAARDLVLTADYRAQTYTANQLKAFDKDLETMDKEDRKWLLSVPKGVNLSDITQKGTDGKYKYPNIQKYYKIPQRASSVGGFRHNFDMVRIDAEPWLTGYKDIVLFENHPGARRAAYAIRQAVKWTKITWTALSPTKIANDAISNALVLIGHDVPVAKIAKYGNEVWNEIGEFEKLRVAELDARAHGRKKEAEELNKKIQEHPMGMMLNNGMMQSINIELFQRDSSVVSGVQKDIEKLLNDFVLLPKGEKSSVFKAIRAITEYGDFGVESVLEFAGKSAKNLKILQAFGEQLESSAGKIENLKKDQRDEYMAKYVSQFLLTPDSEAVQLGSSLVQRADIVARGVLVRHLMDTGSTEEEAVIIATDAFINYKQNMPKELKLLSDYGILLFPSFWMRVQRVIWSLLKRNPATALAALSLEEIIQLNIPSVFDANILTKLDNGIIGAPPILGFWQ